MLHRAMDSSAAFPGGGYITPFLDERRRDAFASALREVIRFDDLVMDVAAGTGALSLLAARHSRSVLALEDDERLAYIGNSMIAGSPYGGRIEQIVVPDLLRYEPPRLADVLICEVLSAGLLQQPQAPLLNHYLQFLRPGGLVVPAAITNLISMVHADFNPCGIGFKYPFRERTDLLRPVTKSEHKVLNSFAFDQPLPRDVRVSVAVEATVSGTVNALRIETHVALTGKVSLSDSDTLCPALIVPLSQEVEVVRNARYDVAMQYAHAMDVVDGPLVQMSIVRNT
jgi:predicted RNA methylase